MGIMIIHERDRDEETERDTHTYREEGRERRKERKVDYKGREGVLILQIVSRLAELSMP